MRMGEIYVSKQIPPDSQITISIITEHPSSVYKEINRRGLLPAPVFLRSENRDPFTRLPHSYSFQYTRMDISSQMHPAATQISARIFLKLAILSF